MASQRRLMAIETFLEGVVNPYPECEVERLETVGRTSGKKYKQLVITRGDKYALRYVPILEWRTGTFVDLDIVREQALKLSNSTFWGNDQDLAAHIAYWAKDD
jgi:hypothetical protein